MALSMYKRMFKKHPLRWIVFVATILSLLSCIIILVSYSSSYRIHYDIAQKNVADVVVAVKNVLPEIEAKDFNKEAYEAKLLSLANHPRISTSTQPIASSTPKKYVWPVSTTYPQANAILPNKRIVAYYGNFYSKGMGVLGEYPHDIMLQKLKAEVDLWNKADPTTPALPAIDYIVTTAQGSPGRGGLYMQRMPDDQIQVALDTAREAKGIVILDVQVGLSSLQKELPLLEKYLKMPDVHLAIDPEFSMKTGAQPGTVVGTYDATDINYAAEYLAKLVKENNLPPKVLIVHRFTQKMVTNYSLVRPLPEVQIVIDMDGWGPPEKKIGTYKSVIYPEPVQFTGFKLFYKNDLKPPSNRLLLPEDLLKLEPQPSFIQYQ